MTQEECAVKVSEICEKGIKEALDKYGKVINPMIVSEIFKMGFNVGSECGRYVDYSKEEEMSQKPKQSTPKLTEFEKLVRGIMCEWSLKERTLADAANELLSIARKQIVGELKDYKSDAPLGMLPDGWFVGVEDCINKIKEGSI